MLRVTNFIERYPKDGSPITEPTTAYLGYTRSYLFVAFVCQDKTPQLIRGHMLARDSLGDDDSVQIMLDTFNDQRRAFVFSTNALGIQADGLYSEQNGTDFSFDTVWDTWGRRTKGGYVVLMRIPFSSLYFRKTDAGEDRTWGVICNETSPTLTSPPFGRRAGIASPVSLLRDIAADGFRDIEHGQNLQFEPYALARNLRHLNTINPIDPYFEDKHLQGYTGLDAKFIIHNSLILDTTVNPDFSQVGVDNPATPNQRFPLTLPRCGRFLSRTAASFKRP